jgi:hypothetical protein
MIGLTGIVSHEDHLNQEARENAIRGMRKLKNGDYTVSIVSLKNLSLGLIQRANGNNKDLAFKKAGNCLICFSGYGKFSGEKKLCWAEEMVERLHTVILKDGPDVLNTIEGSFSCVIVYSDEFIMISDRVGSKSCYSYSDDEMFVFGPSVSGIMDFGLIKRHKNINAVMQVLVSGFFLDDSTLIKNVTRFPAASVLKKKIAIKKPVEIKKYWKMPRQTGEIINLDKDLLNTFKEKLQCSIYELNDLESRSVIPLSGGLDSRTIACFLAKKQKLRTITYDFGDETVVAANVCKTLQGKAEFFSKKTIKLKEFREELTRSIREQENHSVTNQYFYAPLFRKYFMDNSDRVAIYDGVYMDILFSAPYTHEIFGFDRFLRTYCGSMELIQNYSWSMKKDNIYERIQTTYNNILKGFENSDDVSKSQQIYLSGRLRRYVSETYSSRENYCYVFKPGFDYDLMDFGFSLNLNLRKGLLYTTLLNKEFPDVMKILYKDSYGNRKRTALEKIKSKYSQFRSRLSSVSQGIIKYYPYQADYYFLHEKGMDEFKSLFMGQNYIEEIFNDNEIQEIFNKTKKKQYLLNLFSRVLFLQQFYQRNEF